MEYEIYADASYDTERSLLAVGIVVERDGDVVEKSSIVYTYPLVEGENPEAIALSIAVKKAEKIADKEKDAKVTVYTDAIELVGRALPVAHRERIQVKYIGRRGNKAHRVAHGALTEASHLSSARPALKSALIRYVLKILSAR